MKAFIVCPVIVLYFSKHLTDAPDSVSVMKHDCTVCRIVAVQAILLIFFDIAGIPADEDPDFSRPDALCMAYQHQFSVMIGRLHTVAVHADDLVC